MLEIQKALKFFPLEKFINSEASTALNQTWGTREYQVKNGQVFRIMFTLVERKEIKD